MKMNQTIETLKNRRSVRQYLPKQIEKNELDEIMEAAIYAPTGHNDQPWHFTIIQNKKLIDEINEGAKAEMRKTGIDWISNLGAMEGFNIFHRAPTVVIVSGKKDATTPLVDCSAAVQNMLIAAESMNIGSCWIGFAKFFFTTKKNLEEYKIPEDHEVHFGVALGYKANDNVKAPERNKEVFTYLK